MAKAPSKFSDVTVLKYKKGEQIIKQGDYGISIYVVLNGYVEVFRESEGADLVLGTLGPGDIFGEMIFLTKGVEVRTASARALQDSEIEVWHPDAMAKKYEEIAPVLKAMINQVLGRLLRMQNLLDKLAPRKPGQGEAKEEKKTPKESRRRYYRKNVDIGCDYLPLHAGKDFRNPMKGHIKNLSMTGLRMEVSSVNASSASHEVGKSFRLETVLPNGQPLKLTARIVNVHKQEGRLRLGMHFHDLPDYDGTRKTLWFFMLPT
jgi:CRP/FNR family cyclic AMP-dependent transcriptional regulator